MADKKKNLSIHPRNWPGAGNYKKKNTSSPRNPARKGVLARAYAELDRRLKDHTATLARLEKSVNPGCFRKPGSMKI